MPAQVNLPRQVFYKEVALWKRLSHPNIVPFLGVCDSPAPLSMVSEWMPNDNVRQYVQDCPQADRLQLVCPSPLPSHSTCILMSCQLLDICYGLQFLHAHDVIHGDLKGVRVSDVSPVNTDGSSLGSSRTTFW